MLVQEEGILAGLMSSMSLHLEPVLLFCNTPPEFNPSLVLVALQQNHPETRFSSRPKSLMSFRSKLERSDGKVSHFVICCVSPTSPSVYLVLSHRTSRPQVLCRLTSVYLPPSVLPEMPPAQVQSPMWDRCTSSPPSLSPHNLPRKTATRVFSLWHF